jgi:hypothetical protein
VVVQEPMHISIYLFFLRFSMTSGSQGAVSGDCLA